MEQDEGAPLFSPTAFLAHPLAPVADPGTELRPPERPKKKKVTIPLPGPSLAVASPGPGSTLPSPNFFSFTPTTDFPGGLFAGGFTPMSALPPSTPTMPFNFSFFSADKAKKD